MMVVISLRKINTPLNGGDCMKGYFVSFGYIGWIPSRKRYLCFVSEEEYREYYENYEEG